MKLFRYAEVVTDINNICYFSFNFTTLFCNTFESFSCLLLDTELGDWYLSLNLGHFNFWGRNDQNTIV